MHTIARTQPSTLAHTRLRALLTRYRALIYFALFVFAVVLALAERRDSGAVAVETVATTSPAPQPPADADDRPLALPDR